MGRLKTVGPRLKPASGKLQRGGADLSRTQQRRVDCPSRAWYGTARWQKLRAQALMRDGWTCQQTKVVLVEGRRKPNSAVVDHITPHNGDPVLFWDINNLQSVAKSWHDREKQRREARDRMGGVIL